MASIAVIGNGLYCRVGKPRQAVSSLVGGIRMARATDARSAVLTIRDVAQMTGASVDALKAMQLSHDGPEYVQMPDGRVRYTVEAVRSFQAQRSDSHKRLMALYGEGCAHAERS